jgi:hypothetical protein
LGVDRVFAFLNGIRNTKNGGSARKVAPPPFRFNVQEQLL